MNNSIRNSESIKVMAIFITCLILALSILDAPEYIHCIDMDICEFLELSALLENLLKSDIMRHIFHEARNNFFTILESALDSKESIQKIFFLCTPIIIEAFQTPISLKKIDNKSFSKLDHTFHLIQDNLTLETLKLIEVSIIRS